jgi:hypothetical protein
MLVVFLLVTAALQSCDLPSLFVLLLGAVSAPELLLLVPVVPVLLPTLALPPPFASDPDAPDPPVLPALLPGLPVPELSAIAPPAMASVKAATAKIFLYMVSLPVGLVSQSSNLHF